jgi:hypothetical protein
MRAGGFLEAKLRAGLRLTKIHSLLGLVLDGVVLWNTRSYLEPAALHWSCRS